MPLTDLKYLFYFTGASAEAVRALVQLVIVSVPNVGPLPIAQPPAWIQGPDIPPRKEQEGQAAQVEIGGKYKYLLDHFKIVYVASSVLCNHNSKHVSFIFS